MSSLEIGRLFTSVSIDHSEQIEILKRTKSVNIKRVHIKAKYSQIDIENTPLIKEFNFEEEFKENNNDNFSKNKFQTLLFNIKI